MDLVVGDIGESWSPVSFLERLVALNTTASFFCGIIPFLAIGELDQGLDGHFASRSDNLMSDSYERSETFVVQEMPKQRLSTDRHAAGGLNLIIIIRFAAGFVVIGFGACYVELSLIHI